MELLARTGKNARKSLNLLAVLLDEKGFNLNEVIGDKVHTFWHDIKERRRFFDHLLGLYDLAGVSEAEQVVLENMAVLPPEYIAASEVAEWLKLERIKKEIKDKKVKQ